MPSYSDSHVQNEYLEYSLTVSIGYDAGKRACPTAYTQGVSSGNATEMVSVSKPQGRKVVTFSAIRANAQPEIPDPSQLSSYEELLHAEIHLEDPKVDVNGRYVYSATATFVIGFKNPVVITQSKWPFGRTETGPRQDANNFVQGGFEG